MKSTNNPNTTRVIYAMLLVMLPALAVHAQTSATPGKRAHHEMIYDPSGKSILMAGGSTPNPDNSFVFFNDLWRYTAKGWTLLGNPGDERSGIRMAYDSKRKKIYSFGGFTKDNNSSAQLRVLEGNSWNVITDLPEMKSAEPGFVYDSKRDRLIAFGGSPGQRQVNAVTWEWDGATWKKFDGTGPDGRQAFAMVFDSRRNKTLLYGGMDNNGKVFNDGLWQFDGTKWEQLPIKEINPGKRLSPGYTYDTKRGMFILFGGVSGEKIQRDTWGWDGTNWKLLADTGPAARVMGYMAYDAGRDRIVLFGGRLGWPNDTGDSWEFDGATWRLIR